jgi:hypothetical protein
VKLDSGSEYEDRWIDYDSRNEAVRVKDNLMDGGSLTFQSKESGGLRSWPASSIKRVDVFPVKDESEADQEDA